MQPKRPLLPELDPPRGYPEPRPRRRPRYDGPLGILPGERLKALFERRTARERPRLVGRPGADLAVAQPGREIGIGLLLGNRRDHTLDADLPGQGFPVKAQRRVRV